MANRLTLIFVLIVPKNENTAHLETLAVLAHIFGESTLQAKAPGREYG